MRGLDYYTHTLFEFQSQALDSAQSTIVGGGRYNGLVESLGGPETPGIGFGSGIERVLLHLDAEDAFPAPDAAIDVFVVDVTDGRQARDLTEAVRDAGMSADRAYDGRSMKAQMKAANRSGALAAVIVGSDEVDSRHGDGARSPSRPGPDHHRPRPTRPPSPHPPRNGVTPRDRRSHPQLRPQRPGRRAPHRLVRQPSGRPTSGGEVSVCGWVESRREHGEHLAFIDLRDRTGIVQCVVSNAHDLRSEYVLRITGTVTPRIDGTVNPNLATGEIEVQDCTVEVLSKSKPSPFPIDDRTEVDETVRLRHRYVDLRRSRLQRNLQVRTLDQRRHPAGVHRQRLRRGRDAAADRVHARGGARLRGARPVSTPGNFYALPQSPQIYKQLCMVGGVDRYFQIARCLRDEDLRADRQFEFTQLDMEMSFGGQEEVIAFVTDSVKAAVSDVRRRDRRRHPPDDVGGGHGALRLRQARRPLRDGAGRADADLRRDRGQRVQGALRQGHPPRQRQRD